MDGWMDGWTDGECHGDGWLSEHALTVCPLTFFITSILANPTYQNSLTHMLLLPKAPINICLLGWDSLGENKRSGTIPDR